MCIGVPMEILSCEGLVAHCCNEEERREQEVDMSLLGEQPAGTWVLVFLGVAREVIEMDVLDQVLSARKAMAVALEGGDVDAFFADLIDREPELPNFLKEEKRENSAKKLN
ncbi:MULTISPECIES: HypC/HybG/HupF family hydrogenase formation chaperone [Thiomicrorhabdus]|uniref:HypC/HybG/HupF family hydrogenase formation chaperone n=1 Tax=Thiomicrorhabdus heinhorstiae TaxID=2748010 RepID=A0ABS0BV16_9GAMM|nr:MULTISPECIES: HypC/HybG/HupF family hydrogenase formation chaperone [Thiomicrorhabdus]MBF6057673.1 HypC/HybG/HupF family hydrogenase formation chaperone [Thiomicrorhabdus heinhorstiae]